MEVRCKMGRGVAPQAEAVSSQGHATPSQGRPLGHLDFSLSQLGPDLSLMYLLRIVNK